MDTVATRRRTLIVLCGIFLADGIVMAALGPALPDLARQSGRSSSIATRVTTSSSPVSSEPASTAGSGSTRVISVLV